ncbi:hypothetical protein [Nonomuraea rhodomycinica]|uniref:Uncharacterized protein n=1 Tax=Nonomuraea rhodomycinica TaxID=1712872 RepID=A0A7Y6IX75_9ACTN|nr:hypothetical protein [Nonomuraea rhodomycinica]NUW44724.1 hypothetical protein [Nonomuraea rhodomycinica]
MRKRFAALALVSATSLLATAAPAFADSAAEQTKTLSFRGMTLKIPADWKVHRKGDTVVVVTGLLCKKPEAFAPDCESFWIFGPKAYTNVPVGGGSVTYTGKYQFHPSSGVIPCPYNSRLSWMHGEKASYRGLRQVGPGHKAQYTVWPNTCVTNDTGRVQSKWNQREWFLPKSKILVVDAWNTYGLPSVLKRATWS